MGFFDWAKAQFIEIIEWVDDRRDTLVYRFPVYRKEIKNGAQLTVREGQVAVFVSEGQIGDVFEPGMHTLTTQNMPILSTIKGWKYGFESPFKAEVYFVSTRLFTDQKWGTPNPIMMRDPDFGVLRLRAFGSYAMRVVDAGAFLKEHIGSTGLVEVDAITDHLRNLVVGKFADALGESQVAALDLAAKYDELAEALQGVLNETFKGQGLALENVVIENISLPPEVEQALDTRSKMAVLGDMGRYQQFQTAEATKIAAANEGMGGAGMAMGAGFAMGNQMMHQMGGHFAGRGYPAPDAFSAGGGQAAAATAPAAQQQQQQQAGHTPPAPAGDAAAPAADGPEAKLQKVAKLLEMGLITAEEAQAHRAKILESML